jgi:hypothetical protein
MDDWFDRLEVVFDQLATTVEAEVELLTDRTIDLLDQCQKSTDRLVDQVIDIGVEALGIAPRSELEATADRWSQDLINLLFGLEHGVEQVVRRTEQTIDPLLNEHKVCVGCRHYHGYAYGGEMLVCGMHPYGCQTDQCPDWESTWNK